jgi:hypothetical protein
VTTPSLRRIEREDKEFARCRLSLAREESVLTDPPEREAPAMNTTGTHPLNQHQHLIRAALAATMATLILGGLQLSPAGDPPATPTSMHHHRHDY